MSAAVTVRLFRVPERGLRVRDLDYRGVTRKLSGYPPQSKGAAAQRLRSRSRPGFCEVTKVTLQQQRWLTPTKAILTLPLTKTVAEPVWSDDEEHLIGSAAMSVNAEASLFLFQADRSQF